MAGKNQGELKSYTPSWSDQLAYWLAENWYGDDREGVQKAKRAVNVSRVLPPVDVPLSANEVGRSLGEQDYLSAAIQAGLLMLPGKDPVKDLKARNIYSQYRHGSSKEEKEALRKQLFDETGLIQNMYQKPGGSRFYKELEVPPLQLDIQHLMDEGDGMLFSIIGPDAVKSLEQIPELESLAVAASPEMSLGEGVSILDKEVVGLGGITDLDAMTPEERRILEETLMHELQHFTALYQDLPQGSSPTVSSLTHPKEFDKLVDEYFKNNLFEAGLIPSPTTEVQIPSIDTPEFKNWMDQMDKANAKAGYEIYQRIMGEDMARFAGQRYISRNYPKDTPYPLTRYPWEQDFTDKTPVELLLHNPFDLNQLKPKGKKDG